MILLRTMIHQALRRLSPPQAKMRLALVAPSIHQFLSTSSPHHSSHLQTNFFSPVVISSRHRTSQDTPFSFFSAPPVIWKPRIIVPDNRAYVIERFGAYFKTLHAGIHFVIPFIERIAHVVCLQEKAIHIPNQSLITKDNVSLVIDGALYVKITNPRLAAYAVQNLEFVLVYLAQTTLQSEIGLMTLDECFVERNNINMLVVRSLNAAVQDWGVEVFKYEIRDINPPQAISDPMVKPAATEPNKRAKTLASEGNMHSRINTSEGLKRSVILVSLARMRDHMNRALGEADSLINIAGAKANRIQAVSQAPQEKGAVEGTTLLLPGSSDPPQLTTIIIRLLQVTMGRNNSTLGIIPIFEAHSSSGRALPSLL